MATTDEQAAVQSKSQFRDLAEYNVICDEFGFCHPYAAACGDESCENASALIDQLCLKYGEAEYQRGRRDRIEAMEAAKDCIREASYPLHRGLHHPGAFTHCQDAACRSLLGALVQLTPDALAEAEKAER